MYGRVCSVLSTGHKYGAITGSMDIIKTHRKGKYVNKLEKYHIYEISKNNLQINDTDIAIYSLIFRALQKTIG
jgi:hypothetical protein